MKKYWYLGIHRLWPTRLISRVAGWLADSRWTWWKNHFIDWFVAKFQVDLAESEKQQGHDYQTFNDFFTRHLRKGARRTESLTQASITSPVDGYVYQLGRIYDISLVQAKGQYYDLISLLGGNHGHANFFRDGTFSTFYLAPHNYHRIHMPIAGQLQEMIYIPGRLLSVAPFWVENVPRLFARNERVVCLFHTEVGMMAVILVGAMVVGGIQTVWHGVVTPPHRRSMQSWDYGRKGIRLRQGDELGAFRLGSSVIVIFGKDAVRLFPKLRNGQEVKMGENIGEIRMRH